MNMKRRTPTQQQRQRLLGLTLLLLALVLPSFFPALFGEEQTAVLPSIQSDTQWFPAAPPSNGALYFINVGQGDASLIASNGEYVLIDGGPGSAENELAAFLESLGIQRFRAVIATHPHEDHIGGLDMVLERFPTDALYMPDRDATASCFEKMLDAAEAQKLEIIIPEPGELFQFGDAVLEFLSPDPENDYEETNDFSIVAKVTLGGLTVLYMGDAEKVVEDELLESGFHLDCDIIKIGHHGSNTSSSEKFLRAVSPETAIISCAEENDYGHPHPETLQTLEKLGATVLYTYNGTIVLPEESAA